VTAVAAQSESSAAFDLWAEVYDRQPNPVLGLEQRYLSRLLPSAKGLRVLDAGCGTGRWLRHFAADAPRTLIGTDTSQAMLQHAALNAPTAELHAASADDLPVRGSTIDLAVASFVAGYLNDLPRFAAEIHRVARPGAHVFLSDLHPHTAAILNWKRGFTANGAQHRLANHRHSIADIIDCFERAGFTVRALLEPAFEEPERSLFAAANKMEAFDSFAGLPAIYILELQKCGLSAGTSTLSLSGARVSIGPHESARVSIAIDGGKILSLLPRDVPASAAIDLSGYLALPGLVNAHDHLDFGLFPRLGDGPYLNSAEWAHNIHGTYAALISRHNQIPKQSRCWWGVLRNLLCGVTTVCHHNPIPAELDAAALPIRIVRKFSWAHSLTFDREAVHRFRRSPGHLPFILHAAEGVDEESAREIFLLDRCGMLEERTILVHGLALTPVSASLLSQRGCALVICPTSNQFLFHRNHTREILATVGNVLLGSDSPLTAKGDLLDEVQFARRGLELPEDEVFAMVTTRAAKALRLENDQGRLVPGGVADLIAVRDYGNSPASTLSRASAGDIELVVTAGEVQLASAAMLEQLPETARIGLQPLRIDNQLRWVRAPLDLLFSSAESILSPEELSLAGKAVRRAAKQ
jgi:cytosine/adenosine deaminase-related metal-dependent hydrolase/ubiquinone/menaquinone biosynthesis C-methylase UbiE